MQDISISAVFVDKNDLIDHFLSFPGKNALLKMRKFLRIYVKLNCIISNQVLNDDAVNYKSL